MGQGGFMEDPARDYFQCTEAERATFEAGIKLGSIYHQFVGTPLSQDNVESLQRAIEEGVRIQPFVEEVQVHIDRSALRSTRGPYRYVSLTGPMLAVELTVRYGATRAVCTLEYVEDLRYPLMRVKSVEEASAASSD